MMAITDTMAITLVVTGAASIYLIVHAVLDLFMHERKPPHHD